MKIAAISLAAIAALAATPAAAQNRSQAPQTGGSPAVDILRAVPADQQPDVVLDIPNLSVEEITLEVQNLRAKVALEARLANLLHLSAGADASIESVKLSIKGVQARAALIVRLDNVKAIIDRTLQTLDNNPQIVGQLTNSLDNTVNTVGGVANNTVNTVGNLTENVLRSGAVLNLAQSGLTLVNRTVNATGETVQRVRDRSGGLYEVVTDTAGKIVRSTKI